MAIGDWSEEDVKNGLRTPRGELVGGLNVLDYTKGRDDFSAGIAPPEVTSASYDLGRRRAAEDAEEKADLLARLERDAAESNRRVRELLKDRPDVLAAYDKSMAAIAAKRLR